MVTNALLDLLKVLRWTYVSICNTATAFFNFLAKLFGANIRFYPIDEPLPEHAHLYQLRDTIMGKQSKPSATAQQGSQSSGGNNQSPDFYKAQSDRNFARYEREKARAVKAEKHVQSLEARLQQVQKDLTRAQKEAIQAAHAALAPKPAPDHRSDEEILGVGSDHSLSELKNAHIRLVGRYHPDKHQHMSPAFQQESEHEFQRITRAYERLKARLGE